jgi:uncharacterized SAM-binding protein YcdF (DUF218 family)
MTPPSRRRLRRLALLTAVVAGAVAASVIGLPALGLWLVVADPLAPSDAIVVVAGTPPAREVEAAALYHRKLAPVVLLSRARERNTVARSLARFPPGQMVASGALVRLGVPDGAILRLEREVENSVDELAHVAEVSRARGYRRVILVSSPPHTRRLRMIWDAEGSGITALIQPTPYETFDQTHWWRSRHGVETVVHELGGMLNFKLGSLLPTFDAGEARR